MSENDKNSTDQKRSGWRAIADRFKSSTTLAKSHASQIIPDNVLSFFRCMADPSDDDPELKNISNPYQHAKARLNKIWGGRDSYSAEDKSPVAQLTTFRGAVTSYYTGEKWKKAALQTAGVVSLATLSAANTVWIAESYANVLNTASMLSNPENQDIGRELTSALGKLFAFGGIQVGGAWGMVKTTGAMHKDFALSIKRRFKDAAFEHPDMLYRVSHNTKDEDAPDYMPDNPHQRINDAADQFAGGLTRLTTDAYIASMTAAFVGYALYQNSVPIEMLNGLGEQLNSMFPNGETDFKDKGTFAAAVGVIGAYVAVTLPKGISLSKVLKETYGKLEETRATVTKKLVKAFDNSEAMAASKSHNEASAVMEEDLNNMDVAWRAENNSFARYIMFMQGQSFVGHNLMAFLPSFASTFGKEGILSTANPVQTFFETQGLVSALMGSMSQVVYFLPEFARMKKQGERINEMAQKFELARDKESYFRLSGIHEFKNQTLDEKDSDIALRVTDFELMHRGKTESFVKAPTLEIAKGDWVHVQAPSGAGKSCLMRGLAGYWGYGRGLVERQEGASVFYAHQTPDLSGSESLMDHLLYGMPGAADHDLTPMDKEKMKQALQEAGLGQFAGALESDSVGGKGWDEILSGGQKQRIVLARILYQEPDVILLDEATSALDPHAKQEFFDKLDMYCGNATLIAITHDENRPMDDDGAEYFNKRMSIDGGVVALNDIEPLNPYALEQDANFNQDISAE